MRDIVQQAALRLHGLLESLRHVIEIAAQIGDFVAPAGNQRLHAGIEPAVGKCAKSPTQVTDRLGEIPGKQSAGQQADDQRSRNWQQ